MGMSGDCHLASPVGLIKGLYNYGNMEAGQPFCISRVGSMNQRSKEVFPTGFILELHHSHTRSPCTSIHKNDLNGLPVKTKKGMNLGILSS